MGTHLLSSNTDGFHAFSVGRGAHIVDSSLSFMGDDALNFHNRVAVVLSVSGAGAGMAMKIVDLSDVPAPEGPPRRPPARSPTSSRATRCAS